MDSGLAFVKMKWAPTAFVIIWNVFCVVYRYMCMRQCVCVCSSIVSLPLADVAGSTDELSLGLSTIVFARRSEARVDPLPPTAPRLA